MICRYNEPCCTMLCVTITMKRISLAFGQAVSFFYLRRNEKNECIAFDL